MIQTLKTLSDETRLRLLRLCEDEELNVHELTEILGMAQSRISNHLKLLKDEGLLTGRREGSWSYYRMPANGAMDESARRLWTETRAWMDASAFHPEDLARRESALEARGGAAEAYFEQIGAGWDDIGLRLVDDSMRDRLLGLLAPPDWTVADVGCGAGRFLERLAPIAKRVIGVEPSEKMLAVSRERVKAGGWKNVQLRKGTLEDLPLKGGEADAIFCNLVLHHSKRPERAVAEMARALKPMGRLVVCDFAMHSQDWMREEMADFWLGFESDVVKGWMRKAGLKDFRVVGLGKAGVESGRNGKRHTELEVFAATAVKRD